MTRHIPRLRVLLTAFVALHSYHSSFFSFAVAQAAAGDSASGPLPERGRLLAQSSPADGDVRLVDGQSPLEGRVEIYHHGAWGIVCDDNFNDNAAMVVCKQLGMFQGMALCCAEYGTGDGSILLDEVSCLGNETSLAQCGHNAWGDNDCSSAEAAGVMCSADPPHPPSPPAVLGGPRDLAVPPPVRCLGAPSSLRGTCIDNSVFPLWYFSADLAMRAFYRVVYVYGDGARSCPSPTIIQVTSSWYGQPELYIELDVASSAAAQGSASAPSTAIPAVIVQRQGQIYNVVGSRSYLGPSWLDTTWLDAYMYPDASRPMRFADRAQGCRGQDGLLLPAGPSVAGWRWKYGRSGVTDGYLPSTFPDLTATANPQGINATYQLVYELADGYFSYPDPSRFVVTHPTVSAPLVLYVQLTSGAHPVNMVALLLQRVEGATLWTVGRLGVSSAEIQSGARNLLFTDNTSISTHGCPSTSSSTSSSAPPPLPAPESSSASAPPPLSLGGPSPLPSLPPPPPSDLPRICRLLLVGLRSDDTSLFSAPLTQNELRLQSANLDCWAVNGSNPVFLDAVVTVEVGPALLPLLSYTGVNIAATPLSDSANPSSLQGGRQHSGVTFVGVQYLTLIDSVVMDLPLSQIDALVRFRDCQELAFANVTVGNLMPAPVPQSPPPLTPGFSGNSNFVNITASNVHGAVAASGVRSIALTDFSCFGVSGAHGWACLLLEYKAPSVGALSMQRCNFRNNSVVQAPGVSSTASAQMRRLLQLSAAGGDQRAAFYGAGAVAVLDDLATPTRLAIQVHGSIFSGNQGGSGSAFFCSVLTDSLVIANSTVTDNRAAQSGGAVFLATNASRVIVQQASVIKNNTASTGGGGAFYIAGMVESFTVDGSSVSKNTATNGPGGGFCSGLWVNVVSIQNGSSADDNYAAADGGFLDSDSASKRVSIGTDIRVSGRSSASRNKALVSGGAFSAHWIRSVLVSDRSSVDNNTAREGGAFSSPYLDRSMEGSPKNRSWDSFTVTGYSSVSSNYAALTAGAVFVPAFHRLSLLLVANNSRLDDNKAGYMPGGVKTWDCGDLIITGGSSMSYNKGMGQRPYYDVGGGALYAQNNLDSLVIQDGGAMSGNGLLSGGDGGAVKVNQHLGRLVMRGQGSVAANNSVPGGHGGFVAARSAGVLEISDGGSVVQNSAQTGHGGAVTVDTSIETVVIRGGVLANNTAFTEGGAVYVGQDVTDSVLVQQGAIVEGNRASTQGGGFLFVGGATQGATLIDGSSRVCYNSAALSGGAIMIGEAAYGGLKVTGNATACGNVAEGGDGGLLYGAFTVPSVEVSEGGSLEGNRAAANGGAVATAGALLNVTVSGGGRIADNRAGSYGGAFFADFISSAALLGGSVASGNAAGSDGGLVYATRMNSVKILGSAAVGNSAGRSGGVLAVLTLLNSLEVSGANLSANLARWGAGGVMKVTAPQPGAALLSQVAAGPHVYSISDGTVVHGNSAYLDGGAFSISADMPSSPTDSESENASTIALTVNITGSRFAYNYAGGAGGALSVSSPGGGILDTSISISNSSFVRNMAGSDVFRMGSSISSGYGGAVFAISAPQHRADAVMSVALAIMSSGDQQQIASPSSSNEGSSNSASLASSCALHLSYVTFEENSCKSSGGALAVVSCPTAIEHATFSRNGARAGGGAVAAMVESLASAGSLLSGVRHLRRRTQQQSGSGGTNANGTAWWLVVSNSTFDANFATESCGGGLYSEIAQGAGTRVSGTVFSNNEARDLHGGGLCLLARGDGAAAELFGGTQLVNNSASRQGGGVYAVLNAGSENVLAMDNIVALGNAAAQGGALMVVTGQGSGAALSNVTAEGNTALADGGVVHLECTTETGACGPDAVLTLSGCHFIGNSADGGSGGAVYATAGTTVAIRDSHLVGNQAGVAGGNVAAVSCSTLTVSGGTIVGGSAGRLGGGVFAQSCDRVFLEGLELKANRAVTGGGAFFAGPSDDVRTVQPAVPTSVAAPAVMLVGALVVGNEAFTISHQHTITAVEGQGVCTSDYQRFGGHGGGLFAFGNISVLILRSDLRGNNSALVGAAVGSTQSCAYPGPALSALAAFNTQQISTPLDYWQWGALKSQAAAGCWPLLLGQSQLPSREVVPLWMQDPSARSLQALCAQQQESAASASLPPPGASSVCASVDPDLLRACALSQMLAACSPGSGDASTEVAEAGNLGGALLDVAPTHMRLESFSGKLRPGTPVSIAVRLYNGLGQPVQRDVLSFTVTVSIEPAQPAIATGSAAASSSNASHLTSRPQRPWQDANIALLDHGAAVGASLTEPVANGLATWPYLTARGWPGQYTLVFTALGSEDAGLYQIAPLRVGVELLPCQPGEALDLSWAQQPGAHASWLACSRCSRGRFTLWRDDRPQLWDIDRPDYLAFMKDLSEQAADNEATCMSCPSEAICPGGAVMVPEPGYWQSALDSAFLHRCPNQAACELASSNSWASMPDTSPWELQVGIITPEHALVLINATSNIIAADYGDLYAGQAVADFPYMAMQSSSASTTTLDARSGWLVLCQQLGYMALYYDSSPSNSSDSSPAVLQDDVIFSLRDLVWACGAWGSSPSASSPYFTGLRANSAPYLQLQCDQGYTSRLCAACQPGYFINAEFECRQCPSTFRNIILSLLSLFGGIALVLYTSITNLKENYAVTQDGTSEVDEEEPPSEFLKVAIVHAQFYIIITRLPVAYPNVISKMQAAVSAATGAESSVAFSYSCVFPEEASSGQARSQLLGSLLVPCVIVVTCLIAWALRYLFYNRARLRRGANIRQLRLLRNFSTMMGRILEVAVEDRPSRPSSHGAPPSEVQQSREAVGSSPNMIRTEPALEYFGSGVPKEPDAEPRFASGHAPAAIARAPRGLEGAVAKIREVKKNISEQFANSALTKILIRLDETLGLRMQLRIMLMIAVFILYPGWAQAALSIFACYHIDDGATGPFPYRQQATWRYGYWVRDMSQECYSGVHLSFYVPIGVASVLLLCLLPPLTSFLLLWRHRHELDDTGVRQKYGFLYSRYKPKFFWWESALMLEELLLVAVEVFGRALPAVSHQILLMLATFIVLSLVNMACSPVTSRLIVLLEFLSLSVLSLTITLSLYFVVGDELDPSTAVVVGSLIVAINVALLLGFCGLLLRRKWSVVRVRSSRMATNFTRRLQSLATWRPKRLGSSVGSRARTISPQTPPEQGNLAFSGEPNCHGPMDTAGEANANKLECEYRHACRAAAQLLQPQDEAGLLAVSQHPTDSLCGTEEVSLVLADCAKP